MGDMEVLQGTDGSPIACVGLERGGEEEGGGEEGGQYEGSDADVVRNAVADAVRALQKRGLPIAVDGMGHTQAAAEGAVLSAPAFKLQEKKSPALPAVTALDEGDAAAWERGVVMATQELQARTWADMPANLLNATHLCAEVERLFKDLPNCRVVVRDEAWISSQGMEGILAVNRGSVNPPRLLEIHYTPALAEQQQTKKPVVLVGKGVTFDSGGISIKPASNMHLMKGDMGGGAAVIAAIAGVARLGLPVPVSVIVPLVENMPSGSATKPGDVYRAANGKYVEVINTDAEGRLILADALHYACSLNPSHLIDVATLTGAVSVALGDAAFGCFARKDNGWRLVDAAARKTGQNAWRLPMYRRYLELMKSDVADIANANTSGMAGSCTAAIFLNEFVGKDVNWIHLDIAGVMHSKGNKGALSKGMTGIPTRTLIELVNSLQ